MTMRDTEMLDLIWESILPEEKEKIANYIRRELLEPHIRVCSFCNLTERCGGISPVVLLIEFMENH